MALTEKKKLYHALDRFRRVSRAVTGRDCYSCHAFPSIHMCDCYRLRIFVKFNISWKFHLFTNWCTNELS